MYVLFLDVNIYAFGHLHVFTLLELGMWSASFYIGNFIGPTAAGFLVDAYGFEWTTVVFFSLYGFILLVDIFELSFNVKKTKEALSYDKMEKRGTKNNNETNDEKLPLLESNR